MNFDHILAVLKLAVAAMTGIANKPKPALPAPMPVTPSKAADSSFDSGEFAIFCLGIIAVVSVVALVSIALKKPVVLA